MAAAFISLAIILAASIDIGFLFFQKRDLQKIADMAAIAGAQELSKTGTCSAAAENAVDNAKTAHQFPEQPSITCGRWDASATPNYSVYAGGVVPGGQPEPNAIHAEVTRTYRSFFGAWAQQSVTTQAIATIGSPTAVFSVGSNLLTVDNTGALSGLVSGLTGLNSASLVGYNGLASANIQTSALLAALGIQVPLDADVGTIKEAVMLNTANRCSNGTCPLESILGAISTVAGQQNLINTLGLSAGELSAPVNILSDASGQGGIISMLDAANGTSALKSQLNAMDLATTALGVANGNNFASTQLALQNIPGITTNVKASIIEPPGIGMGGVGATAYTAQVRLSTALGVDTSALISGLNLGLGTITPFTAQSPLQIDAISGKGTITDLCTQHDSDGNPTATIAVSAQLLTVCTSSGTCGNQLQPIGEVTLSEGETGSLSPGGSILTNAISNLVKNVLSSVLEATLTNGQGSVTNSTLAANLLGASGNSLSTAVTTLNSSLTSLNNFLGSLSQSGTLSSVLGGVSTLVGGLTTSVTSLLNNLVGNLACTLSGNYNQCMLSNQLSGNQSSGGKTISNVMLSLLALIEKAMEPILNTLGNALVTQLKNLLGVDLNRIDVKLIDLNCGGGENVRLVY
jgi:uncharacterized membrane protein